MLRREHDATRHDGGQAIPAMQDHRQLARHHDASTRHALTLGGTASLRFLRIPRV
jgi:hypothetical protein